MQDNTSARPCTNGAQTSPAPKRYWQRSRFIMRAPRLTSNERLVLLAISDHLGDKRSAWPSTETLQRLTSLGRSTVLRTLKALEQSGRLSVTRSTGRANRYRLVWEKLNPFVDLRECQSDTRPALTPVPERHQYHSDTPPVPERHPTRPALTPEADQRSGSEKRITIPPKPPQGGRASDEATSNPQATLDGSPVDNSVEAVDKSTETTTTPQKPSKAPKKRTRKPDCLSVAEVIAVEIPAELASVEGYAEGFRQWCEVRPGKGWRQKPIQVERFHTKMLKAHRAGLDVIRGLSDAFDNAWKGISPSYLKPLEARPSGEQSRTDEAAPETQAWGRVLKALRIYGAKPPGLGADPWVFSNDTATADHYNRAILAAAEDAETVPQAWRTLYQQGSKEARLWQWRRFRSAYRRALASDDARALRGVA
jgi:Fe2+ or Zn2+ uptake regulation protein